MVEGQVIPTISHHHQPLKAKAELLYQLNSPVASEKYVTLDNRVGLKSSLLNDINNRKGNKEILLGKFNEGARSGYKADPVLSS